MYYYMDFSFFCEMCKTFFVFGSAEVVVHEGEDPLVAAIHLGVGHRHIVVMILLMVTSMLSELCDSI